MATLQNLIDRLQNAINDISVDTWSEAILGEWLCDGIRDYNNYFRRTATAVYNPATSSETLNLSRLCREVLSVEYPTGNDPPDYLNRLPRFHPDFYDDDDNFAFEPVGEYGQTDDGGTNPFLIFSSAPTVGETITVVYRALHDAELDTGDLVTVPDEHQHMLILFGVWKAHTERTATQMQAPDTTIRMIQQMKEAARIAEADYRRAVQVALRMAAQGGWTQAWTMDTHDRIY